MIIIGFSIQDKSGKIRFFEEIFLLVHTNIDVVLEILFLTLTNQNIQFDIKSFTQRSYITTEALPTTKQIKLINKHKFAKTTLDKNSETFVIHIVFLNVFKSIMLIYTFQLGQVVKNNSTLVVALEQNKTPIKILPEYIHYADLYFPNLAIELPKNIGINKYAFKLVKSKQLPYEPIYS